MHQGQNAVADEKQERKRRRAEAMFTHIVAMANVFSKLSSVDYPALLPPLRNPQRHLKNTIRTLALVS